MHARRFAFSSTHEQRIGRASLAIIIKGSMDGIYTATTLTLPVPTAVPERVGFPASVGRSLLLALCRGPGGTDMWDARTVDNCRSQPELDP
jgi:hypothetical protein